MRGDSAPDEEYDDGETNESNVFTRLCDEEYDDGETNESDVFTRLCGRGRFKICNRVGCV